MSRDLNHILETGYFANSRSAAPSDEDSNVSTEATPTPRPRKPILLPPPEGPTDRTSENNGGRHQEGGLRGAWRDRDCPGAPREVNRPRRRYPPRPSVEEEAESLARELDSQVSEASTEEIPSQGDVDQLPILLEVHEFNPERRFVLLSPTDDQAPVPEFPPAPGKPNDEEYEVNTGKKFDPPVVPVVPPGLVRQPSVRRPTVVQDRERERDARDVRSGRDGRDGRDGLGLDVPRRTRSRANSSGRDAYVDQKRDRERSRPPPIDTYLEPEVVKHSSSGRDKSYHDFSRGPSSATLSPTTPLSQFQRSRSNLGDDRRQEDMPRRGSSNSERRGGGGSLDRYTDTGRHREGVASEKSSATYPHVSRSERASLRRHESNRESSRRSPPRSPGEDFIAPAMMVRKPTMDIAEGEEEYAAPETVVSSSRSKGRQYSDSQPRTRRYPGASPRSSHEDVGPRGSAASLPVEPPYPDEERAGRLGVGGSTSRARSRSRASVSRLSTSFSAPIPIPAGTSPSEFRRSGVWAEQRSPSMSASPSSARWEPGSWNPDRDGLPVERPRGAYRRYSEDLSLARLPDCRRRKGTKGATDWMTMRDCSAFNICPTCYEVFKETEFRNEFVPVLRSVDEEVRCDFGSCQWYRIAWLIILKHGFDNLKVFPMIHQKLDFARELGETCPGERKTRRKWLGIVNPATHEFIPNFDVCFACASTIQLIFPNLNEMFTSLPTSDPIRGQCAMRFSEKRRRFKHYFDLIEMTADRTASAAGGVLHEGEVERLAKEIGEIAPYAECEEDRPVYDAGWHVIKDLPFFTVCGDCFEEAVKPRLERGNVVAQTFYINCQKVKGGATCQLYSERMRDVFRRACRRVDMAYLVDKARERKAIEADIRAKLERLMGETGERVDDRMEELIGRWKKWE